MQREINRLNMRSGERLLSALAGTALTTLGLREMAKSRSWTGAVAAAAGAAMLYRGGTGYCPLYAAAERQERDARSDSRTALGGQRGTHVEEVVNINKPPAELFRSWQDVERLPEFMHNLISVKKQDDVRSHWIVRGPGGKELQWDAEIINQVQNELIGWRTLRGADVVSAGSVRFKVLEDGRGTEVRVRMQYGPPLGRVGAGVARLFGKSPSQTVREDLRRFKQLAESGEVATIAGQPRGHA